MNSAFFCLGLRARCKSKEDGKFYACKQLERSVKLIVWKNPKLFFFFKSVLRIKLERITLHPGEGFTGL